MALLSQCKTLAGGSRAFSGLRARQSPVVSNGSRVMMRRRDSYMVEVNVGEDEPEDIAVRKFMKKVMESGVIEELRNRRYKETPLQEYKRRTKERIAARKMGIRLPTWEEEYGTDPEVKPFDEFYQRDPANTAAFVNTFLQYGQYGQEGGQMIADGGGYMDGAWSNPATGGYPQPLGDFQGAYMNQDLGSYPAGAYIQDPYNQQPTYVDPAAYGQPVADYQQEGYAQPPPQGYQ